MLVELHLITAGKCRSLCGFVKTQEQSLLGEDSNLFSAATDIKARANDLSYGKVDFGYLFRLFLYTCAQATGQFTTVSDRIRSSRIHKNTQSIKYSKGKGPLGD